MCDQSNDIEFVLNNSGTPAVITQSGEPDKPVTVLFDLNSVDQQGMITDKPQATVKETDLTGVVLKDATITINGTEYRMTRPIPDGAGLVSVGLTRN